MSDIVERLREHGDKFPIKNSAEWIDFASLYLVEAAAEIERLRALKVSNSDTLRKTSETKHTPGPWKWQGEDYRAGWGLQMLVGPSGEGIIVGQAIGGGVSPHLRAHQPVAPELCITGVLADGKEHAEPVHVFSEANARLIAAAPDMLEEIERLRAALRKYACGCSGRKCDPDRYPCGEDARAALEGKAKLKITDLDLCKRYFQRH